ncbi:MAG TPA: ribonuclease E/G [Rhodospirillales bacterium]|nr:ribonuclease E/G [Rhodospirillales bacterium]
MPIDEVLISALAGDRRAAARHGGTLVHLVFDAVADSVRVGDLRMGRILTLVPAMGGAFVDIGADRPGLLMRADVPPGQPFGEGEKVVVRVVRTPDGTKGAKLDARLPPLPVAAAGARAPALLEAGADPVAALLKAAAGPSLQRVVIDDAATLAAVRTAVPAVAEALRFWQEATPLFTAEGIDEAIEAALAPEVPLPSGGRLHIEETTALVAIDVDSGATGGGSSRAAALACDREAAAEIGRQIRLRDLAGLIVVDFVPLRRPAEREQVLGILRAALAGDDRHLRIGGWTRLGLLEMVRQRREPSLRRRLTVPCPTCTGAAAVRDPRWVAGAALRAALAQSRDHTSGPPVLTVPAAVAAALNGPLAAARRDVEARLGCALAVAECGSLPADGFHVQAAQRRR